MDPNVAEAARRAGDPNRLIPGEDSDSRHPDDARHWLEVYAQLISTKEPMLARAHADMAGMNDAARQEIGSVDVTLLEAQLRRLRARLAFWGQRLEEVTMGDHHSSNGPN